MKYHYFTVRVIVVVLLPLLSLIAQAQTISGTVIFDANNNGVTDGSDAPLPAMTVEIYDDANSNNIPDPGELDDTDITDRDGAYSFTSVNFKAIVIIRSSALGSTAALRDTILVANGVSNTAANLYVFGQYSTCYAFSDGSSDLISFNRNDGVGITVNTSNTSADIEAACVNYDATRLYAMNEDDFEKYSYQTGARIGSAVPIGNVTYRTAGGGTNTRNIADCDGISMAGENEIWVTSVDQGGILFKIDTSGTVQNNVFGTLQGVEIVLPAAISSCAQLDDIAASPFTGILYGIYNGCTGAAAGREYIVEIPTTGASAGVVTTFTEVRLGGTLWTDIEGLTFSSTGELMGTTGNSSTTASQQDNHLIFDNFTGTIKSGQPVTSAGSDFESCDCITRNSNPFVTISISGTVFNDEDELTDGNVDGTPISEVRGQTLFAYLTDPLGVVVQKSTLTNGTYTFDDVLTNFAYGVVISTTNVDVTDDAPSSANLPGGLNPTGEDFGTNNQVGTGVESGTPTMSIAVTTATTDVTGVNFGLNDFNIITGTVWLDEDSDENLDPSESGRAENVKVYIYEDTDDDGVIDVGSSPIDSVLTNASGEYRDTLPYLGGTDSYIMTIDTTTLPTGQVLTTDNIETASFTTGGTTDAGNNFGYVGYSIGNSIWWDNDNDGIKDDEEIGIPGVSLILLDNQGNTIATTTTDLNGNYNFNTIPDGNYQIAVTSPLNSGVLDGATVSSNTNTTPDTDGNNDGSTTDPVNAPNTPSFTSITNTITLGGSAEPTDEDDEDPNPDQADNRSNLTIDFGFEPPTTALGNSIFWDRNNDGDFDAGVDTIVSGVKIYLYQDSTGDGTPTELVDSVTSDANGEYSFDNLGAGTFRLVIAPSNFDAFGPLSTGTATSNANSGDSLTDDNSEGSQSGIIILRPNTQPTADDGDNAAPSFDDDDANFTFDFGFHGNASGPLPVTLTFFTAEKAGDASLLGWETASEVNNSHFDIERSKPNGSWEKIGEVEGNGTTNTSQLYSYTDDAPAKGLNIYRLKQVDFDGTFQYSPSAAVIFDLNGGISVYPNPAKNKVTIVLSEQATSSTVELLNSQGQIVETLTPSGGEEVNLSFDLSSYSAGIYFIKVYANSQVETIKLVID
jgi:hypothetical protein